MSYSKQLHPWCVTRCLPNQKLAIVARFRCRDDAVAYLQLLRRSIKDIIFTIYFDGRKVKKQK
jgi:hypothetical protein